jgi:DNA-binding NarL/FixJ family response regulator
MRILIADDNAMVRRGIAALVSGEEGCEICGEASSGAEVLRLASDLHPDVILLDVSMPGPNGLDTTRALKQRLPGCRVLVISQHDPQHLLPVALEAGAVGCLDKSRIATDLVPTLRSFLST